MEDLEKTVRTKEFQVHQKNPKTQTVKNARELLRKTQSALQKDFQVDETGRILEKQRLQKGIYQFPNGSLQFVLVSTNVYEARAIADMVSQRPGIREYIPARNKYGLRYNAPSSPTQWEGVSVGLYGQERVGDDSHVVLSFNKEKSEALFKEKPLPLYISHDS